MAMKQTQTKMFDFSDVGLGFCAGSKNLFPDRFKKMLSLGYNEQTVSSVAVAGNQVTLTYGGTHGYVADRVLKVNAPELLSINSGEFVIDSVTENTVTMTIDGAPASIAGNFTTKVASLGWSLEYENANIHVYKFNQLDESDLYLRLCFQNNSAYRNRVSACVGNSFDLTTGFIDDIDAYAATKDCSSPAAFAWEFSQPSNATYDNYSYSQGYNTFGKAILIGSNYHLLLFTSTALQNGSMRINAMLPVQCYYSKLPMLVAESRSLSGAGVASQIDGMTAQIGNIKVSFFAHSTSFLQPHSETYQANFYSAVDTFNTTSTSPVMVYEHNTGQLIGIAQGIYRVHYRHNSPPYTLSNTVFPVQTMDVDLLEDVYIQSVANSSNQGSFFASCIEEIKIVS